MNAKLCYLCWGVTFAALMVIFACRIPSIEVIPMDEPKSSLAPGVVRLADPEWTFNVDEVHANCPPSLTERFRKRATIEKGWPFKGQEGEDIYMYEHFFHQSRGEDYAFIEIGAYDGVRLSNSYFYEYHMGWSGLLIEGATLNAVELEKQRSKHPKRVATLHQAICEEYQYITLHGRGPMAQVKPNSQTEISRLLCVPMRIVLDAIFPQWDRIDFFSLDVEGAEISVLLSHDWLRWPIATMLAEMRVVDEKAGTNQPLRRLLYEHGMCRFDVNVGHSNEVWVTPDLMEKYEFMIGDGGEQERK